MIEVMERILSLEAAALRRFDKATHRNLLKEGNDFYKLNSISFDQSPYRFQFHMLLNATYYCAGVAMPYEENYHFHTIDDTSTKVRWLVMMKSSFDLSLSTFSSYWRLLYNCC